MGALSFAAGVDEDRVTEAAIEAGADDVVVYDDGAIDVITSPEAFNDVKDAMVAAGFAPDLAEVTLRADNDIAVSGDTADQVRKLLARMEEMDDVQNVYSNAELSE